MGDETRIPHRRGTIVVEHDPAMKAAMQADRLAIAAGNAAEAVGKDLSHHEAIDDMRFETIEATLKRIEEGVEGLYKRWWSFAIGLIVAMPPLLLGVATVGFWLGGRIPK